MDTTARPDNPAFEPNGSRRWLVPVWFPLGRGARRDVCYRSTVEGSAVLVVAVRTEALHAVRQKRDGTLSCRCLDARTGTKACSHKAVASAHLAAEGQVTGEENTSTATFPENAHV